MYKKTIDIFPFSLPQSLLKINASVAFIGPHEIALTFTLIGDLSPINFSSIGTFGKPQDNLWKHTCFEFFMKKEPHERSYFEWNQSLQGAYQAYYFQDYRKDGVKLHEVKMSRLSSTSSKNSLIVESLISGPFEEFQKGINTIHPTCVIQMKDGTNYYYAKEHLKEVPDFHFW